MIHHLKRATRHLIFWTLIATAIGMTGIRLVLSGVESYKTRLAVRIGEHLDAPVTIGRLGATMRGFSPELVLSDIDVASDVTQNMTAIALKEIRIGINLLDVLIRREFLAASWVTLVGAKLSVIRAEDGSISIAGLKASDAKPLWLLQGAHYEVLDSDITWQDQKKSGRPLTFESVDVALINDGEKHRINVLMQLPKRYGETLRVSMNVSGNIFEPANIRGSVFAEGKQIQLPEWVTVDLPFNIDVQSGSGDFQVWGEWRQSQLYSLNGLVQLDHLALHRQEFGTFPVERLKSEFQLKLTDSHWQLDVKRFLMETLDASGEGSKQWPDAVFSVAGWRTGGKASPKIALYADRLDLQETALITQFFMPPAEERGRLLRQAQLNGSLRKFALFADLDEKTLALKGTFADLGMAPVLSLPGLKNLTGQIAGDEKQGIVQLASKDALVMSDWFRKPLAIDRLDGQLAWRQTPERWIISSPMLELNSLGFKSRNRLRFDFAKTDSQPFIDLQSSFSFDDVSKTTHFLPSKIMKPIVVEWFDRAFIKGSVAQGELLFYGKPANYPFKDGTGVFETRFDADQLELVYDPLWPRLSDVSGSAEIYQDDLTISLDQGTSHQLKFKEAHVAIPSLSRSEQLQIQGEVSGGIGQALDFLQHTPLNSPVDKLLDATVPQGDTQVKLGIKIPLRSETAIEVDGTAQLHHAKLQVTSLKLPVSQIQGTIRFDEQGVYSDTIHARALGYPIRIDIRSDDQKTLVNVTGHSGISDLQKQFKMPWWQLAEGATDYRLQLRLPYDQGIPELDVESNLQGIALNLPGALAKTKDQQKSLSMMFNLGEKSFLPLELDYDHKLKAAVKLDIARQAVLSGRILLGQGEVFQRQEPGIAFEINSETLALRDWLGFSLGDNTIRSAIDDVMEIQVHTDQAFWRDSELGNLDLKLKRDGGYWDGDISSPFVKGRIKLPVNPQDQEGIKLNFDRFELSALKKFQNTDSQKDTASFPDLFPLLSVTSKNTLWQSTPLGALILETERGPERMRIKRMELKGIEQTLSMSGDWKARGEKSLTQIEGRLELSKAGELFSKLGITKDLTETSGAVDFSFNWQGPPFQFSIRDLRGELDLNLKKGRLLSIEPGFGRILGILAMAQWLKRLQLDFSDVYEEGLTFNSIKGNFVLADGKAVTHNLVVDAVPAKIALSGNTDLIHHSIDHIVDVTPKSADALPIAGTIMGKVAAFVAKSLTGAEHEGFFFGSQYRVKGDWGNVQISSLHENDGLLQKTWNGITDFPWLNQQDTQ